MTSQIPYLIRRLKQRHISLMERNRITFQLGKFIEEGEQVSLSIKAKRGARRTYYLYKDQEEQLSRATTRPRDLASMSEEKFQELLMGHSEIFRGNVLDISFEDITALPQYDIISHDLETVRNLTDQDGFIRNVMELPDLNRNLSEPDGIVRNHTESSGTCQNLPE